MIIPNIWKKNPNHQPDDILKQLQKVVSVTQSYLAWNNDPELLASGSAQEEKLQLILLIDPAEPSKKSQNIMENHMNIMNLFRVFQSFLGLPS